jgi:glyoxylase-like metal-dependent hydrolase (beta-lactamase superfamily II)
VSRQVFAIYEPGQFEEVISYLILGNRRALLFDTGLGIGDIHKLVSELTSLPVTVINSHSHYDHIGGNFAFDTIFAPDIAYTKGRAVGLAHEEVAEFVGPGWIWKPAPDGFSAERYRIRPYTVTKNLRDGQIIDLGERELQVVFSPGHAPDALCLLDAQNKLLFTGDTFYPAPLYTHLPGSDFEQYRKTSLMLATLATQVEFLLPGHNEAVVNSSYLKAMAEAFEDIYEGRAQFTRTDGAREYAFSGFSIITTDDAVRSD